MQNMFEQSAKMMEQSYEQWRKMMGESPFWPKEGGKVVQENMSKWISAMSSAFNANMDAWNAFMEKNEEMWFKMYKESPFYNEAIEQRMREAWEQMLKGQKSYQDMMKDSLSKLEESVQEAQSQE